MLREMLAFEETSYAGMANATSLQKELEHESQFRGDLAGSVMIKKHYLS